jgi:RNA polymerase sigma factor (TIGR02999 family)
VDQARRPSAVSKQHAFRQAAPDGWDAAERMPQVAAIANVLDNFDAADVESRRRVFGVIYEDLRKRARRLLAAHETSSLNTTGLVHEAYLKLIGVPLSVESRAHFFHIAATAMRQIMVDHARHRQSQKRDRRVAVTLDADIADSETSRIMDMLALDGALQNLGAEGERLVRVVELHFFAGLSFPEIADLLSVSLSTVEREWRTARAFLYRSMQDVQP